uniref:ADP-ribosyl-[dinitrogen reductase] hydrolase n=1 Tax=Paenibacillus athensensis TaxID=1967502 RepID=A0A4Y8QAS5_9BACL
MDMLDRIKGGLYGVAVGDALGGTTEFMSAGEIKRQYGYLTEIVGGGVWQLAPGEVTDDTQMTLCVAEGILANPADPVAAIGDRFLHWYKSNPKDIGNIIRRVLATYEGNWFAASFLADQDLGQSAGNGSLMRCLPVALIYPDLEEVERVSRLQSKMTHYDELCNDICILYNRIAYRLLQGEDLHRALDIELAATPFAAYPEQEPACEPSGYVVHSLSWAVHHLSRGSSFADTVQRAANGGGDSDTIAAIAGGLAGVYYGFEQMPAAYREAILIRTQLDELAQRMTDARRRLALETN